MSRSVNSNAHLTRKSILTQFLNVRARAVLNSVRIPNVTVLTQADERTSFPASLRLVAVPGETTLTPNLATGTLAVGAAPGLFFALNNVGTGTGVADSPGVNGDLRSIGATLGFTAPLVAQTIVITPPAPGASGNVMTSNGATWASAPLPVSPPITASYVVQSADGTLTNERVLDATNGFNIADNGPGNTIDVVPPLPGSSGNVMTSNGTDWASAALPAAVPTNATYVVQALTGGLSDERVLDANRGFTIADSGPGAAITVTPPAPSTSGNVMTSNGTDWASAPLPAAVPTNATYVVQALSGGLSDERVLAATSGFSIADGGANGNITVTPPVPSTSGNVMTSNGTNWTSAALPAAVPTNATYVVQALSGGLSDERVLAANRGFTVADGGANGNITVTPPLPSTSGNVMTSNGTDWTSTALPAAVPTNATYVVQSLSGGLSDERVLAANRGFGIVDGGANGNITVTPPLPSTSGNVMTSNGTDWVSSATPMVQASYVTMALNAGLTSERVLAAATRKIAITDGGANGNVTLSLPLVVHMGSADGYTSTGADDGLLNVGTSSISGSAAKVSSVVMGSNSISAALDRSMIVGTSNSVTKDVAGCAMFAGEGSFTGGVGTIFNSFAMGLKPQIESNFVTMVCGSNGVADGFFYNTIDDKFTWPAGTYSGGGVGIAGSVVVIGGGAGGITRFVDRCPESDVGPTTANHLVRLADASRNFAFYSNITDLNVFNSPVNASFTSGTQGPGANYTFAIPDTTIDVANPGLYKLDLSYVCAHTGTAFASTVLSYIMEGALITLQTSSGTNSETRAVIISGYNTSTPGARTFPQTMTLYAVVTAPASTLTLVFGAGGSNTAALGLAFTQIRAIITGITL